MSYALQRVWLVEVRLRAVHDCFDLIVLRQRIFVFPARVAAAIWALLCQLNSLSSVRTS
jgi:hypothetical protein